MTQKAMSASTTKIDISALLAAAGCVLAVSFCAWIFMTHIARRNAAAEPKNFPARNISSGAFQNNTSATEKNAAAAMGIAQGAAEAREKEKVREMVLRIKYPLVDLVSGPSPIAIKNIEPSREREVLSPEITVPVGVVNLARNKKVTSSDMKPAFGELSFVTDGDTDAAEGYEVQLAPGSQWVQIDLEESARIYAIQMWHFHRRPRAYKAVTVQISDDPEFKTNVTNVFNTDLDNTNGRGIGGDKHYVETHFGKLIPIPLGIQGRYVRLYSAGNTSTADNHYIEVEVYGIGSRPRETGKAGELGRD